MVDRRSLTALSLALVLAAAPALARGAVQGDGEAGALFASRAWDRAAEAYRALADREPANATYWYRLGVSLQELGRHEAALVALLRADAAGVPGLPPPATKFRAARSYARLGERDRALEWLERAVEAGFAQPKVLETHPDFESLRGDQRFAAVVARAKRAAFPCRDSADRRAFDFWVGEWDVFVGDQLAGTNRIERLLEGCVLMENWESAGGGAGKSINFYDAAAKRWRQTWIDSRGGVLELSGEWRDGAMRLEGESAGPNGARVLHKLTFTPLSEGRLRQHWRQSTDGGKTWTDAFDGTYVPKKKA